MVMVHMSAGSGSGSESASAAVTSRRKLDQNEDTDHIQIRFLGRWGAEHHSKETINDAVCRGSLEETGLFWDWESGSGLGHLLVLHYQPPLMSACVSAEAVFALSCSLPSAAGWRSAGRLWPRSGEQLMKYTETSQQNINEPRSGPEWRLSSVVLPVHHKRRRNPFSTSSEASTLICRSQDGDFSKF